MIEDGLADILDAIVPVEASADEGTGKSLMLFEEPSIVDDIVVVGGTDGHIPAFVSIMDDLVSTESGKGSDRAGPIVDIGPIASPVPAHEMFPQEFEWPLVSPSAHNVTALGAMVHGPPTATKRAHEAHGAGVQCSDCKTGGAATRKGGCIVGGVEFSVGGWGQYEADRRRAQWDSGRLKPSKVYGGRTYITGADVAVAIGGSERTLLPLKTAAEHLEKSLGVMEDVLCDPSEEGIWECLPPSALVDKPEFRHTILTVPSLTSEDMKEFARDPEVWSDPDSLESLIDDVNIVAASIGVFADTLPPLVIKGRLPPLPTRMVSTDDDAAVLKLEAAVVPYISSLEEYQAAVAGRLDAVATAIDTAVAKHKKTKTAPM